MISERKKKVSEAKRDGFLLKCNTASSTEYFSVSGEVNNSPGVRCDGLRTQRDRRQAGKSVSFYQLDQALQTCKLDSCQQSARRPFPTVAIKHYS